MKHNLRTHAVIAFFVHHVPVEDENLLLIPGVRDLHVGDHDAVDVGRATVETNVHLQRRPGLHGQVVVDQDLCRKWTLCSLHSICALMTAIGVAVIANFMAPLPYHTLMPFILVDAQDCKSIAF
jgi:hypothetical protein